MQVSRVNLQTTNNRQKQNHSQPAFGIFSERLGNKIAQELGNVRKRGLQILDDYAFNAEAIDKDALHVDLHPDGGIKIFNDDFTRFHLTGKAGDAFHAVVAQTVTDLKTGAFRINELRRNTSRHQSGQTDLEASRLRAETSQKVVVDKTKANQKATDRELIDAVLDREDLARENTNMGVARIDLQTAQREYDEFFSNVIGAKDSTSAQTAL